jgi:hypothetical protein
MKKYSAEFEKWWHENRESESLRGDYENYRLDVERANDDKTMSFKQWAFDQFNEIESGSLLP